MPFRSIRFKSQVLIIRSLSAVQLRNPHMTLTPFNIHHIFPPLPSKSMTRRQSLACWGSSILASSQSVPFSFSQWGGRAYAFRVFSILGLFKQSIYPRYRCIKRYSYSGISTSMSNQYAFPQEMTPSFVSNGKQWVGCLLYITEDPTHCDHTDSQPVLLWRTLTLRLFSGLSYINLRNNNPCTYRAWWTLHM